MHLLCYNTRMDTTKDCIFCKIVHGKAPAHKIWESKTHTAFLDIFPVVPGATVVIPKEHHDSYIKNVDGEVVCELIGAVREVMDLLDRKLEGNMQTKLIFEGLEVAHLHAKLWPMYPGVKERVPEEPADTQELAQLAEKIRS